MSDDAMWWLDTTSSPKLFQTPGSGVRPSTFTQWKEILSVTKAFEIDRNL